MQCVPVGMCQCDTHLLRKGPGRVVSAATGGSWMKLSLAGERGQPNACTIGGSDAL